jgi:hypothetical protein
MKETLRECCDVELDLQPYHGTRSPDSFFDDSIFFCIHCGQLFFKETKLHRDSRSVEKYTRISI